MPRRKQPSHQRPHVSGPLIRVNGEPARKKARRDYEKARRDLEKARLDVDRFKTEDQPAFGRWLNSTFGPLLTALRELGQQIDEKEILVEEIEDVSIFEDVSMGEAYRRVMHRRAHPEDAPPPPEFPPGDPFGFGQGFPNDKTSGKDKGAQPGDPFAEFSRAFEEFFGQQFPPGGPQPMDRAKPATSARVKDLYRTLVRKLHPDVQEKMTSQKLEWWHEVQKAYAAGDAERLEIILNLCETEDGTPGAHTSVSLLLRITAQVKASLKEIKREVNRFRREPAWQFSKHSDRTVLELRIRTDLESEFEYLRQQFAVNEGLLREWAREAERAPAPQSKKRSRRNADRQPDFFF